MAVASSFKPLAMADLRLPTTTTTSATKALYVASKPSFFLLPPSKPLRLLRLSCSLSPPFLSSGEKKKNKKKLLLVPLVASQTSDWARQEEEESEVQGGDLDWPGEEETGAEAGLSEWEGEGEGEEDVQKVPTGGEVVAEAEAEAEAGFVEGEEDSYQEPPEDAKLFVGNIPYDLDSEKLAQLFEKAGVVEVAEVIYSRETDQSRGFGFVTMSTVEEAEKAVEMFHSYEVNGRLLTVNKAAPRGARVERTFEPTCRIYVGNLPWSVDDAQLVQLFSEHGKVKDARVVCDRESGRSRGFGFVIMSSQSEMDDAIAALDGKSLDGRALRVNVAEERPRRASF